MRQRLKSTAPWALVAALGGLGLIWVHAWAVSLNDYGSEAAPALTALVHGHLSRFLELAPAYGGSLELRAPFALLASLAGGHELAIYRASAVPCSLAAAMLGVWLVSRMARRGASVVTRACVLALCVVNPITYEALSFGHPEELLGGVLCVAAVLCAADQRPVWAGLLLGLAIGNKEWALIAVGPVLMALPSRHVLAMAIAAAVAAALLVPVVLPVSGGLSGSTARLATKTGEIFHPFQVWWFLGEKIHWIPAMSGTIPRGGRLTPGWLDGRAHLIVVGVSVPLTLLYHRSRRVTRSPLLLLALLLLLRCILDPWDVAYYPLPFILAVVTWEAASGAPFAPIRGALATATAWIVFEFLPNHVGVDVQALVCTAVAVPAVILLARATYGADRESRTAKSGRRIGHRPRPPLAYGRR